MSNNDPSRGRDGQYTITSLKDGGEKNQYLVTLAKDGKNVGEVMVLSTSSASAYYNDPIPEEPTAKRIWGRK